MIIGTITITIAVTIAVTILNLNPAPDWFPVGHTACASEVRQKLLNPV